MTTTNALNHTPIQLATPSVIFGVPRGVLGISKNKAVVWFQGCSHKKCIGCTSPHTWNPRAGVASTVEEVLNRIRLQWRRPTGLVITGGEPLDQPAALLALIDGYRVLAPDTEVLLYTAHEMDTVALILGGMPNVDVLITGRFEASLDTTPLAGSRNQQVHLLTPYAQREYANWQLLPRVTHSVQIREQGGAQREFLIGIPTKEQVIKLKGIKYVPI